MTTTMIECPLHGGAYDCTPFCKICEGNQEYEQRKLTYEFLVTKTQVGKLTVQANNEDEARELVIDHAARIVLINNMSPWSTTVIKDNLIGIGTGEDND